MVERDSLHLPAEQPGNKVELGNLDKLLNAYRIVDATFKARGQYFGLCISLIDENRKVNLLISSDEVRGYEDDVRKGVIRWPGSGIDEVEANFNDGDLQDLVGHKITAWVTELTSHQFDDPSFLDRYNSCTVYKHTLTLNLPGMILRPLTTLHLP